MVYFSILKQFTRFCLESVSPVTASCPSSLSVQHTDLCQYMDKHPGGLHPDNIRVSEIFKLLLGDFVMKWLWSMVVQYLVVLLSLYLKQFFYYLFTYSFIKHTF